MITQQELDTLKRAVDYYVDNEGDWTDDVQLCNIITEVEQYLMEEN